MSWLFINIILLSISLQQMTSAKKSKDEEMEKVMTFD